MPLLGDGHCFDHRDVGLFQLQVADLLDGVGQVLVDEHHRTVVDRLAQGAVDLERHTSRQHAGLGELLVEVVAQAGAGHQADLQRLDLGPLGQRTRHGLGFPGAGEPAHADGHAVFDQGGGIGRTHNLVQQCRQAHAILVHGRNLGEWGKTKGASLGGGLGCACSTKVELSALRRTFRRQIGRAGDRATPIAAQRDGWRLAQAGSRC